MECKRKDFSKISPILSPILGISPKIDQNSQREFPNRKCAFHLLVFTISSRSFGLIAFDPNFREKVFPCKFPFLFATFTNRFSE